MQLQIITISFARRPDNIKTRDNISILMMTTLTHLHAATSGGHHPLMISFLYDCGGRPGWGVWADKSAVDMEDQARTNPNLPETLLPSIYVFGSEVSNNNRDGNQTVYAQHITLNNRIEDVFVDILSDKSNEKIGESDSGEYFNKYVAAINKIPAGSLPEDLSKVSRKFSNVVFTNGAMNLLKDYNSRKNLFPMYMQVSFKTDSFTEVSQLLADSFLSGDLMKHVITTTPEQREISKSSFKITNQGQESVTESEVVDTWDMTR